MPVSPNESITVATARNIAFLNHQVCISLIRETRAALGQADWRLARRLLHEFAGHTVGYRQAATALLYPRFALLAPGEQHRLVALYQQQTAIATHTRAALDGLTAADAPACLAELECLHALLSDQWVAEQPMFQTLARQCDEQLVQQLAATLRSIPSFPFPCSIDGS